MKLSANQIDAIVASVVDKYNAELKAKKEAFEKSAPVQKKAKETLKKLESLRKEAEALGYEIDGLGWRWEDKSEKEKFNHVLNNIVIDEFKEEKEMSNSKWSDDRNNLRNKILIASIDSETLAELSKKLGVTF